MRYVQPPGERVFSKGVFVFGGILAVLQTILIHVFAEHGLGYRYFISSIIAAHIYIYARVWKLTRKDKKEPVNFYSLGSGYAILAALLYALPLYLSAVWAMVTADNNVAASVFVENNRALLAWASDLKLPIKRPALNWTQQENAVNIYYLTLALLMGTLGIILSAPLLWLKARGWSEMILLNKSYSDPVMSAFLFLAFFGLSIYFLSCYTRCFSYGHALLPNGEFAPFRMGAWLQQVSAWGGIAALYSFILSGAFGVVLNVLERMNRNDA